MVRRPGLWVEIGLNLALLTLAVSVLDAAVFTLVTKGALVGASTDLAEESAVLVAGQLAAQPQDAWSRTIEAHRREGLHMTLYAPTGAVLAGDDVQGSSEVRALFVTRQVTTSEEGGVVQVLAPVGSGRPVAALAVRLSAASASSPAWTVMGAHAVFSAGIIVLFGFVLFRRSLLLPIARMRDGTRRIASGEFGVSVSEDAPGEIADLASSLNAMSTALAEFRVRTADQLARLELANAELRRTQDALVRSEKLASVGRLAAGLAHELGNPLTAVRGYLEILALDPPPGGEEVLRRCGVEAERMHQLLRNLLDFARNGEAEIGDVDVGELLAEAADTVRHQAAFRPVRVEVDAGQGLVVRGEVTKLHQVLVNLLLNAADAGARSIQLLARRDGADVVLACADDGSGIAPEHLPRLFEPFFTTRPPGKGTGLGLAIAHRVVEQHGGRIEARSEPGAGATFTLRLPATPEPAEAGSAPPGPAAADVPSSVVPSAPAGERRAPPAGIDVR